MDFSTFLQQFFNSLSLGAMYALIAIGYTMIYGVLRLINFAHGDIMMVGAFVAFLIGNYLGFGLLGSSLLAIAFCALLGVATDKIAYKPIRHAPRISLLITAIGVSFFLENFVNVVLGGAPTAFLVPDFFEKPMHFMGAVILPLGFIVPIITVLLLVIVLLVLYKTKYGMAIRALAFDIKTVSLMGIDSNMIISIVFAMGSSLAAVGGIFWAISYPIITPYMGTLIGLKAFAAAVLGGIGSVTGAVIGGLILGFAEVMSVAFFPNLGGYKDAIAFIFLILVLLFRPTGIMGINFEKSRF